jgi:HAD superfamily hydrolase (TIGR01509 family)
MLKGLIFDFDGLIIDTETPAYDAWQDIYADYGCDLSLEKWSACIGSDFGNFDPVSELEKLTHKRLDRGALFDRQRQRSFELTEQEFLLPGVLDTLRAARQMDLKIALASSSPRGWIDHHFARLGIGSYFDCICTQEDVHQVKPEPELFNLAVERLGLTQPEAVVLEDSLNGIVAAKAAKVFCIAIPNPITANLDLDHADLILRSMSDLNLTDLAKCFTPA